MTLDERLRGVESRLVRLEEQMSGFAQDHREILVTLQGPPRSESIRGRLHKLEDDRAAASAAESALDAARLINEQAREHRFTRREQIIGAVLAAVVASGPYLAPLLSHHHT